MSDTDDLVLAVRDYLVAEWPARFAAVNVITTSDPPLKALAYSSISDPAITRASSTVPGYPALYVLSDRSRVELWKTADLTVDNLAHRLDIGVEVIDQDAETLQRLIWYYLEDVVWYLLRAGHAASSIPWHIAEGEVEFEWGPVLTAGAEPCFTDAKISVPFRR